MTKSKPKFNQEMAIRGANRRIFARSPVVREKLEESRQEFPRFKKDGTRHKKNWVKMQCEVCGEWVSSSQIAVDHKDPVVPPDGFPAEFNIWDRHLLFMKRLWCDKTNLQRICDTCHAHKTASERITRLLVRYTDELNIIEGRIKTTLLDNHSDLQKKIYKKEWTKELSKYTTKGKTIGLEKIVQRARDLKDYINNNT